MRFHLPKPNHTLIASALILCAIGPNPPAFCSSEGQLISVGYAAPAPTPVAPGQILTLFFRGVSRAPDGSLRTGQAQTVPLPDNLAGLSAWIEQSPHSMPFRLPLLAVHQHNECEEASGQPQCLLTAIRVQIPTELTPVVAKLFLAVDGVPTRSFLVRPVRDDAHVLTTCDLAWDTNPGSKCARMAFHADGGIADENRPARLGETIVVYAYGLGPTTVPVPSGTPAPQGAEVTEAVARQLKVRFSVFRNANPSTPRYLESEPSGTEGEVLFAGLTSGYIGLYQINVELPESLELPILCGGDTSSNVIARISTAQGVENLPLCVAP